ncbi:hypothetical protein ANCCAN_08214 [Ancylostoma caninum]|uniref:Kinesin motor domain-containing protein n=1 Tax=Ancylostoma caninum TaxID=29170 RepID=A0A368GN59_ANCCA|nr:hypothetical protein ANCCAN_08214 [Ancylostoma caninum]
MKASSVFDKVHGPSTTQERVYSEMVSPQVERILGGYNCTLFAYRQTGTRKTYTMEGGSGEHNSDKEDPTMLAQEVRVKDRAKVYRLLRRNAQERTTAATLMNMRSSPLQSSM